MDQKGKEDTKRSEKVDMSNGWRQLVSGDAERRQLRERSDGGDGNNNRRNTVGCGDIGKSAFGVWMCRKMDKLKQNMRPR